MDWRQTHFDETGRPRAGRHDWPPELALERIEAISQNARATWFALLGLLTFVMVTLLGVDDVDFFGYGRETQLPLVGVSVPTSLFFYAAPFLTAAVYAYFHFYLMKLWDALGFWFRIWHLNSAKSPHEPLCLDFNALRHTATTQRISKA